VLARLLDSRAVEAVGDCAGAVFADDNALIDPEGPEAEPGLHEAGYSLLNMTKLREAGTYDMNMGVIILPRPYTPGDEVKPIAMLKQPLQATVRPVP